MIRFHSQQGDVLSMEQEIVNKEFLERFESDVYKTLIHFS